MKSFVRQVVCPGSLAMFCIVSGAQAEATTSDLRRDIKPIRVTPEVTDPLPRFVAHTNQDEIPPMIGSRRIRMQPIRHTNQDKVFRRGAPIVPDVIGPDALDPIPVTPWLDNTGALPLRTLSNPFGIGGEGLGIPFSPSFEPMFGTIDPAENGLALPAVFGSTFDGFGDLTDAGTSSGASGSGFVVSVIPAPGVWSLLGLAALSGRRRRRCRPA